MGTVAEYFSLGSAYYRLNENQAPLSAGSLWDVVNEVLNAMYPPKDTNRR